MVKQMENYDIYGTPLILYNLPKDFRFDSTTEIKFRVWIPLPDLQLPLQNPNALGKIALIIGEPIDADHKTIYKNSIAGPRIQVLVDAYK